MYIYAGEKMLKTGYLPINEVTPAPLPPSATSWLVGLTAGVVVAIILSIVLAVVFGVVNVNLRDDMNAKLAAANTDIATLEMFAMELAEMSGMNTTYEEFATGRCEIPKGCAADIYSGAFRLLFARTGPFSAMVAEVSPFDTLEAKKRKSETNRDETVHSITGRAPGQFLTITCTITSPFGLSTLNTLLRVANGAVQLTPGQLANFNLTGPNIGNGAGQTKWDINLPFQTYVQATNLKVLSIIFSWYPDYVPCAGDVFDLIAPTKFTLGLPSSSIGASKKRDIVTGPVQREHTKKSVH